MQTLQKIARIISDIFIPPTFNLLGFVFLAQIFTDESQEQFLIVSSSLIFGVTLPIILFVILRKKKIVADNDAVIKEQRHFPYYISIVLNLLGGFYAILFIENSLIPYFWLILSINTAGLTLINHFWKISAHAIGVSIFVSLLFFFNSSLFNYFFVVMIFVGVSRLLLKVHTPAQIIMGTIYGFFVTLLQLNIFTGI